MENELHQEDCLRWLSSQGGSAFLVGGSVRDRLVGRASHDLDVVVSDGAIRLGRKLADHFGGSFYVLDAERGAARALLPSADGKPLTVDLTLPAGGDIHSDLAARDFTINAMAMPLTGDGVGPLLDPHGGWSDLQAGRLRPVSPTSLRDDPVRVLRAVRMTHEFGLEIDADTADRAVAAVSLLDSISAERLRDEMCRILVLPYSGAAVLRLDRWGVLRYLVATYGDSSARDNDDGLELRTARAALALDAWEALLDTDEVLPVGVEREALAAFRGVVAPYRLLLVDRLAIAVSTDRTQSQLVRWVILLGLTRERTLVEAMLTGLRFSRVEIRRGRTLAGAFGIPGAWVEAGGVTPRELHRFFRAAKDCGPEALVLFLTDLLVSPQGAAAGDTTEVCARLARTALQAYFESYQTVVVPPQLIDGTMLIERFGLKPGPQIRELLGLVAEVQAEGDIHTEAEALAWVQRHLDKDST